ncbi:hypothetical protein RHMOL_Rhmol07G0193600 [Rhododendron molle]|uniref:Uncharacterized protein n=1 Tax=Rhododendron molle TaxID=49168 RepID=A0ACC0N339_RHOML|nr:hypothetical protein RHMOL_Rhmol07G0193600 [Rhododendron molle]
MEDPTEEESLEDLVPLKQSDMEMDFHESVESLGNRKGKEKIPVWRSPSCSEEDEFSRPKRERKPKERVVEEALTGPPRQVKILRRPDPVVTTSGLNPGKELVLGDKKGLNPLVKEFRPAQGFLKPCNVVFILPEEAMAKEDQVAGLDKHGRHKSVSLSPQASTEELRMLFQELVGLKNHRPIAPTVKAIYNVDATN